MLVELLYCGWFALGLLEIGLMGLGVAYLVSFFGAFLAFPSFVYAYDGVYSMPFPISTVANKLETVGWFDFEIRAFVGRILLFSFLATSIAGLMVIGISEGLAVGATLAIFAMSIPIYLVYYVLSRERDDTEEIES